MSTDPNGIGGEGRDSVPSAQKEVLSDFVKSPRQNALENESLYIHMRGAGGLMVAGVYPIRRIPALMALMIECAKEAARARDEPPSMAFYEIEH